jgi:hypothetical protein
MTCKTNNFFIFSQLSLFKKKVKVGLWDHHAVCLSVNPPYQFFVPEPDFMKFGVCIMAPEPIWMAYFVNVSHQSVCLYVCFSRQQLGKNACNNGRIVGWVIFCAVCVVSEESLWVWLCNPLLLLHFLCGPCHIKGN